MTHPIRILHLITGLNTGGAEMALSRLLEATKDQGFETSVVSMIKPGPVGQSITDLGIPVTSLNMPPGSATLSGFFRLLRIMNDFRPDILQTWLYHADLLGLLVGKLTGVPAIVWNIRGSEMNFNSSHWLSRLVVGACARFSGFPQVVLVNSRAGQMAHEKLGYHPRNWRFIPNGIDTTKFHPDQVSGNKVRDEWGIPDGALIVGMVARLDPQKDHLNFMRAAVIVSQELPSVHFICVGSGPEPFSDELKEQTRKLGLGGKLKWTGPRSDMPAVFNSFSLTISSSAYGEGFPNVVAESMACGVPCIVTKTGDSPDLVADTGLVVPLRDHRAMAEAILQILHFSPERRAQLGQNARQRIISNFSLGKMAQEYSDLYHDLALGQGKLEPVKK